MWRDCHALLQDVAFTAFVTDKVEISLTKQLTRERVCNKLEGGNVGPQGLFLILVRSIITQAYDTIRWSIIARYTKSRSLPFNPDRSLNDLRQPDV